MRNMFVGVRGGAYSRAGTKFIGYSKQTGRSTPPRLIPFQFSINQGLALEFGNFYMRVISDGAYVTETPIDITNVTTAAQAVVSISTQAGSGATPVNGSVIRSYKPGDSITLAGGTFTAPAILDVTNTTLVGVSPLALGTGYAPADTIALTGGTQTTPAQLTVATTQVVGTPSINAGGTGGTNGSVTLTGTTGTGTKFQATGTISGGILTAITALTVPGSYTANPPSLTAAPVTGGSLTGATLSIAMGIGSVSITNGGVFTANASGNAFTQASTSGGGTGATFQAALFGPNALTVATAGVYTALPSNPVSQGSTNGSGLGAEFNMSWSAGTAYNNGDAVFLSGIEGPTWLNGQIFIVQDATTGSFALADIFGNPIGTDSFPAYSGGGTAARIYTVTSPYAEADLRWIKFTQSADVLSLACWNQITGTDYLPYDLTRNGADDDWTFVPVTLTESIDAPVALSDTIAGGYEGADAPTIHYANVVTAINPKDGTESIASNIVSASGNDIAEAAGTVTTDWLAVPGVQQYNVYKASPTTDPATIPPGALYGYAGTAYGSQFTDNNIVPDFQQVPPLHIDPFAPGAILAVNIISGGSGNTYLDYQVTSADGSGIVLTPILQEGSMIGVIIVDPGQNYAPGDTIAFPSDGVSPTATITVGPTSGTYPGLVFYFQERRGYASSPNNPDTYWLSQPGSFTNFDYRIPTIPSDAITGTPWATEVNGIQWAIPMPGGLVVLTGLSAWQLTGAGGSAINPQPITPSSQQAQPQAFDGCSALVPPVQINYDILFVESKNSIVRDLAYNYWINIYTGTDVTLISSHLFTGYTILERAWCWEPYKLYWAVRDDGTLLSFTFLKEQDISGWARHDTLGQFQSVCSVTEPPVDALYVCVQRPINGQLPYMIERMDNRIWSAIEDCWCVDAALALDQPTPNAILAASSATGNGTIASLTDVVAGQDYSTGTTAQIVDDNGDGPGTGAILDVTITDGTVSLSIQTGGVNYINPAVVIIDPAGTGSGASATAVLDNTAEFTAFSAVFSSDDVGSVIRMGGGIAVITDFINDENVAANIISPIAQTYPNGVPIPAQPGDWTLTAPVTQVYVPHLAGATVTGLADGEIVKPRTVGSFGLVNLDGPASAITIGLGFQAQLQSPYLVEQARQGQRKVLPIINPRIEASRDIKIGVNQPDGSTLSPAQLAPTWNNLVEVPNPVPPPYGSDTFPLWTGDTRIPAFAAFDTPGQVAFQQDNPVPMNVLAVVTEVLPGDLPQPGGTAHEAPGRQQ